jgi:hypothetical protein
MRFRLLLVTALLAAGCAAAPQTIYNPQAASSGSAALARAVVDKQAVTFHDGLQGVILLCVGRRPDMSYNACLKFMTEKQAVPPEWSTTYAADSPLTRGMLAYMLVRGLGVTGGVTLQIFGTSQRYALRECNKLEIIEKGSQFSTVSGREFLSILRKADEYAKTSLAGNVK